MPGDYSRISFDPEDDFVKVQQQQGRLSLDSEWNLRGDILDRHTRVQSIDTMGHAVVPRETPTGFQIKSARKDDQPTLLIGPGRIYVDGIMATNHGVGLKSFDKALEEEGVPATITDDHFSDYYQQRYWLDPAKLPEKPYRVFLDVWRREVTYLQVPEIVEQAVGEETTARVQTVWQVKCVEIPDGDSVSCDLPDELTRPAEGRLSTKAVEIPSDENPCTLPPRGGYGGRDNRCYRLEVHTSGKTKAADSSETDGVATFKWSRDGGSVAAALETIEDTVITLARSKRNLIEEFHAGDWIEILNDEIELDGRSGEMHRVKKVVRSGSLKIELDTAPSLKVEAGRHTRTIRWDQKGIIRDSAGKIYVNIDEVKGVIPVPPPEVALILEHGVQVTFSTAPTPDLPPSDEPFRAQGYWTFAARTADASVERLDSAPPLGIHHHFVPLAIVSPSGSVQDCRTLWPEEREEGGCACTVCVSQDSHKSGKMTIQAAIDRVKETGGTVCLGAGDYELTPGLDGSRVPVEFSGIKKSVRLQGQGDATCLLSRDSEGSILVRDSQSVTLSGFKVIARADSVAVNQDEVRVGAVMLINSIETTIEQCTVEVWMSPPVRDPVIGKTMREDTLLTVSSPKAPIRGGTAIAIGGLAVRSTIRNNRISARTGILCLSQVPTQVLSSAKADASATSCATHDLRILHNDVQCTDFGIDLGEATAHIGRTDIRENAIADAARAGITVSGIVRPLMSLPGRPDQLDGWGTAELHIDGNVINGWGHGIVTGSRSVRIMSNRVTGGVRDQGNDTMGHGIVIAGSRRFSQLPVSGGCEIRANHVFAIQGHGVFIQSNLHCALVSSNIIEHIAGSGIVMEDGTQAKIVSVENNQVLNVGIKGNLQDVQSVIGIGVVGGEQVGIVDNQVIGLGRGSQRRQVPLFGIRAFACSSIRIAGNAVSEVSIDPEPQTVGIAVAPSFQRLDIHGNQIRKPNPAPGTTDRWEALLVEAGQDTKFLLNFSRLLPIFMTLHGRAVSTGRNVVGINIPSLASVPRGEETIGVDGNLFESPGGLSAARVEVGGSCTFSNNRCIQPSMRTDPAVRLKAGALLITNNYVEGHKNSAGMTVEIPDVPGPHALTVVGNICTTNITVNGADLELRWKNVNVLAE